MTTDRIRPITGSIDPAWLDTTAQHGVDLTPERRRMFDITGRELYFVLTNEIIDWVEAGAELGGVPIPDAQHSFTTTDLVALLEQAYDDLGGDGGFSALDDQEYVELLWRTPAQFQSSMLSVAQQFEPGTDIYFGLSQAAEDLAWIMADDERITSDEKVRVPRALLEQIAIAVNEASGELQTEAEMLSDLGALESGAVFAEYRQLMAADLAQTGAEILATLRLTR